MPLTSRTGNELRSSSESTPIARGGGVLNPGHFSVAALLKLHRKSKSIDAYMDDRIELSTTRVTWNEITDNVERGASDLPFFGEIAIQPDGDG